jgi:Domain of unknown function (DUF1918)
VSHNTVPVAPMEAAVEARVGDRIVVHSTHQGEPERSGEVLEVRGEAGGPPYLVKWSPDGHTALFFPAGTCTVVHEALRG